MNIDNLVIPSVTSVAPDYETSNFLVYFDNSTSPWRFHFKFFLAWLCTHDLELLKYLNNHHTKSTFSEMVEDLYSISYPVESKVNEYYNHVVDNIDIRLLRLLDVLRNFGNETPDESL